MAASQGGDEDANMGWIPGMETKRRSGRKRKPFYSLRNIRENEEEIVKETPLKILFIKRKKQEGEKTGGLGKEENELYIFKVRFKGKWIKVLLDTGSNATLIDRKFVDKMGWRWTSKAIDLCFVSNEVKATADGILEKDGYLEVGDRAIRIQPIVADLQADGYEMLIGNPDLLRLDITLGGLPQPRKWNESIKEEEEEFKDIKMKTGVPVGRIYKLTQKLEEQLIENKEFTK